VCKKAKLRVCVPLRALWGGGAEARTGCTHISARASTCGSTRASTNASTRGFARGFARGSAAHVSPVPLLYKKGDV